MKKNHHLLYKLLRRRLSAWQLTGFVLANLCGMTIVLAAMQFAADVLPIFTGGDSFMRPGQMVVAKHVGTLSTLTGSAPTFSDEEVADLRRQPFAERVGVFTPSCFGVVATLGSQRLGVQFSTEMFFESVPDEFIDVDLSHWKWSPESNEIPIILPRNYLNLYNFGFATSQGLPALSEQMVQMVRVHFHLSGTAESMNCEGRVVAFSKKLNTILVPQGFMDHMNRRLSPDRAAVPSRLIVTVDNPTDEKLADYLDRHGLETESDDAEAARTAHFLRIVTAIVIAVGAVISLLAFYVLMLSIFLLLQRNTEKIDTLLLIGYSTTMVARPYHALALGVNTVVALLSVMLVMVLRTYYLPLFGSLYPSFSAASLMPTIVGAAAIYALLCTLHYMAIRHKVLRIWHIHEA